MICCPCLIGPLRPSYIIYVQACFVLLVFCFSAVRVMELEQECVELREASRRHKDLITQLEMDLINLQSLLPSRTEGEVTLAHNALQCSWAPKNVVSS